MSSLRFLTIFVCVVGLQASGSEDPLPPELDVDSAEKFIAFLKLDEKISEWERAKAVGLNKLRFSGISLDAYSVLEKALKDSDKRVRFWAAGLLLSNEDCRRANNEWSKPVPKTIVPILIEMLGDTKLETRHNAAGYIYSSKDLDVSAAIPALVQIAGNAKEDKHLRRLAVWVLGKQGPKAAVAVDVLRKLMASDDSQSAMDSAASLWRIAAPGEVLAVALKGLETADRMAALSLLGEMRSVAAPAVPKLMVLLNDPEKQVRFGSAVALAAIGPEAKSCLPDLIRLLQASDNGNETRSFCNLLGSFGSAASAAVPALVKLVESGDFQSSIGSLDALAKIGPAASHALPTLCQLVGASKDEHIRCHAVLALQDIGLLSDEVAQALVRALSDESKSVHYHAVKALGAFGPKAVAWTAALTNMLKDVDTDVRIAAAAAVWRVSQDAGAIVPMLRQELNGELGRSYGPSSLKVEAAKILGEIGPLAKGAVPELTRMLKDEDNAVLKAAAEALQRIEN